MIQYREYRFEKLEVYELGEELVVIVYDICREFPRSEEFGLTSQLKRAIVSVVLNIAEGSAFAGDKEFRRFVGISIGSLVETRAGLLLAIKLNFIKRENVENVFRLIDSLFFKLLALKKSLSE